MTGHLFTEPPRLDDVPTDHLGVPEPIAEIIDRMLVKDPADRYAVDRRRARGPARDQPQRGAAARRDAQEGQAGAQEQAGDRRAGRAHRGGGEAEALAADADRDRRGRDRRDRLRVHEARRQERADLRPAGRDVAAAGQAGRAEEAAARQADRLRRGPQGRADHAALVAAGGRARGARRRRRRARQGQGPAIGARADVAHADRPRPRGARPRRQRARRDRRRGRDRRCSQKLEPASPPPLKVWYASALARLGDKAAKQRLLRYANDKDFEVSFKAALALADVSQPGDADTIKALRVLAGHEAELNDIAPYAGAVILTKMAALHDAQARKILYSLLDAKDEGSRLAAAEGLAKLGDDAGKKVLEDVLRQRRVAEPDRRERSRSCRSATTSASTCSRSTLADKDPETRRLAARGLGDIGERKSVPALLALASDKDWTGADRGGGRADGDRRPRSAGARAGVGRLDEERAAVRGLGGPQGGGRRARRHAREGRGAAARVGDRRQGSERAPRREPKSAGKMQERRGRDGGRERREGRDRSRR